MGKKNDFFVISRPINLLFLSIAIQLINICRLAEKGWILEMSRPGEPIVVIGAKLVYATTICTRLWVVSSTFQIAQILVQSQFELVSLVLALDATEPVSELETQMAVELINIHLISVQQKR